MFEIAQGYASRHPNGKLDILTFIDEYASSHQWVRDEYQGSDGSAAWEDFLLFKGDEQHWHYSGAYPTCPALSNTSFLT
jgi:hypothetical protein